MVDVIYLGLLDKIKCGIFIFCLSVDVGTVGSLGLLINGLQLDAGAAFKLESSGFTPTSKAAF